MLSLFIYVSKIIEETDVWFNIYYRDTMKRKCKRQIL